MTTSVKIGNMIFGQISKENKRICQLCGTVDECRPYGPNGEQICFDCGMKDVATTEWQMAKRLGETK